MVEEGIDSLELWNHQQEALKRLMKWYKIHTKGLIVMPTGSGKSGIACLAPYLLNSHRTLVVTPSLIITNQMQKAFSSDEHGFYGKRKIVTLEELSEFSEVPAAFFKTKTMKKEIDKYHLVIVNAQKFGTLSSISVEDIPPHLFDLVIIDEAHHYPSPTWDRIVKHFDAKFLFLTATPYNKGEMILKDNIIFQFPHEKAVSLGIIRKLDFMEVGKYTPDFASASAYVCHEVLSQILKRNSDRKVHQGMILTYRKKEADLCCFILNNALTGCACTFHGDSEKENLKLFKGQKFLIMIVCSKLLEGFDHDGITVLGICRNVSRKSKVLFSQFVGRALRKDKYSSENALLISHKLFNQKNNFDSFDLMDDIDPDDSENGPMELQRDETLDQVGKKTPFTKDMLDFTEDFKDYMLDCKEVFSFGIKAENYQFYIELNFGTDQEQFFTECPYDLSQISLTNRSSISEERILDSYEVLQPHIGKIGVFGKVNGNSLAITAAHNVLKSDDPYLQTKQISNIDRNSDQFIFSLRECKLQYPLIKGKFLCDRKNWQDLYYFGVDGSWFLENPVVRISLKEIRKMMEKEEVFVELHNGSTKSKAKLLKISSGFSWRSNNNPEYVVKLKDQVIYENITRQGDSGCLTFISYQTKMMAFGIHLGKTVDNESHSAVLPEFMGESVYLDLFCFEK